MMPDEPEKPRDDPARTWDDEVRSSPDRGVSEVNEIDPAIPVELETVGTGSYVAVSCVAGMGMLLVILILGLLISRWIG